MKNTILNLGKALNRSEQQTINGGGACYCNGEYMGNNLSVRLCWLMCHPV